MGYIELKVARRLTRHTQQSLADAAGLDIATICRIERGTTSIYRVPYASVVRLARVLNSSAEELWPVPDAEAHATAREANAAATAALQAELG